MTREFVSLDDRLTEVIQSRLTYRDYQRLKKAHIKKKQNLAEYVREAVLYFVDCDL